MLKLNKLVYRDNGCRIDYDYSFSSDLSRFLKKERNFFVKYDVDVREVPKSIAVIPFLVNILPISWFLGFDIRVECIDDSFYKCIEKIKDEFQKMYPEHPLKGTLNTEEIVSNAKVSTGKSGMLFSGGVDAISAYIRRNQETPDLITVRGADIPLDDEDKWQDMLDYNSSQDYLKNNSKYYISSNLRTFYTYNLERDLKIEWWGKVQHGLALLGITAPLTHALGLEKLYIASTHTKETQISWGSNPITDELLTWVNTAIGHECYDLSRQDKVGLIVNHFKEKPENVGIRVCYSEMRNELNCSTCEKCLRTIMGIILEGGNPNEFGFNAQVSFYDFVLDLLSSKSLKIGVVNHWKSLQKKASEVGSFFVFEDEYNETQILKKFTELSFQACENSNRSELKYILINKYPLLFKFYLNLRLKLAK